MRKIYAFMLLAILSISAFAETDTNYYWFYDRVEAAPTGKGVVYASETNEPPTSDSDYAAFKEVKFNTHSSFEALAVWAKPAAGYQLAGWFTSAAADVTMEDGVAVGEETTLSVTTEQVSEDDTVEGYGITPDATYYAIFTKVTVRAEPGLEDAADLEISKIANDTGDKITIAASPVSEDVQFTYWTDSKGNKITENPYTFTVSDMDTYTAHFKGDAILTIDFGEGKYVPFSNSYATSLNSNVMGYRIEEQKQTFYDDDYNEISFDESENAWGYWVNEYDDEGLVTSSTFIKYTGEVPTFDASYKLSQFGFNYYAGDAVILYSKGVQSFFLQADDPYPWSGSLLVPTNEGAVDIASLSPKDDDGNDITYYTFDGQDFVKATSGTVAKNECYLVLSAKDFPQPDKILVANSELAVDVREVPAAQPAPQFKGIYTIDGKQVEAPVKGINIIGDRKVWVNK